MPRARTQDRYIHCDKCGKTVRYDSSSAVNHIRKDHMGWIIRNYGSRWDGLIDVSGFFGGLF